MGDLLPFRPRARNTFDAQLARANVRRVWPPIDHDPATGIQYAMDDDDAPRIDTDPFMRDAEVQRLDD